MEITVPSLLRIKPDALFKIGKYLRNEGLQKIALFFSEGIRDLFEKTIRISLESSEIQVIYEEVVCDNQIENVLESSFAMPNKVRGIVVVGGGKAIDYCKYIAFISHLPIITVPTSISNDGFASPVSSLYVQGRRRSLKTKIPSGIIVDTDIIKNAPRHFVLSGIGDLISNITAVFDWKLAFKNTGEYVNDFAALVSLNAAENVVNHPVHDPGDAGFVAAVSGALVMSGVAMEIAKSSRPASGGEHLISHAYDLIANKPSIHGAQVGVATLLTARLQQNNSFEDIRRVLDTSGFLDMVRAAPLNRSEFERAVEEAPYVKENYYTILSEKEKREEAHALIHEDPLFRELIRETTD
jgi:glycerol-1-phosphate dehydrogenase [NAD(P)+]